MDFILNYLLSRGNNNDEASSSTDVGAMNVGGEATTETVPETVPETVAVANYMDMLPDDVRRRIYSMAGLDVTPTRLLDLPAEIIERITNTLFNIDLRELEEPQVRHIPHWMNHIQRLQNVLQDLRANPPPRQLEDDDWFGAQRDMRDRRHEEDIQNRLRRIEETSRLLMEHINILNMIRRRAGAPLIPYDLIQQAMRRYRHI